MSTGRQCLVCMAEGRDSRMRAGVYHLHELVAGDAFRLDGRPEVFRLEGLSLGRASVTPAKAQDRGLRRFTTEDGRHVEFVPGASSSTRPCSLGALVVPVDG